MNRHALRHRILSATCLPFHHSGEKIYNQLRSKRSNIGGGNRNRTGDKGVADPCLTAWLCRLSKMERKTGFEPATPTLARSYSTTELLPQKNTGVAGFEPTSDGVKVRCLTAWLYPKKMGRMRGIEPPNVGITIRCVNHFATAAVI